MVRKQLRPLHTMPEMLSQQVVPLSVEGNAGEIALTPNQPAFPDGAEIVKGQLKIRRQDVDVVEPNSGAYVGDVAQAATEYSALRAEKQQGAFGDLRPAD